MWWISIRTSQEDAGTAESGHELVSDMTNLGGEDASSNLTGDNCGTDYAGNRAVLIILADSQAETNVT